MQSIKNDGTIRQVAVADNRAEQFVALCADQIGAAVEEAFREIGSLSCAVLDSARCADELLAATKGWNPNIVTKSAQLEVVRRALQESVRTASTRLQFADRLEQRLLNVSRNLVSFARLMQPIDLPITGTEWAACLAAARATFTMEQERQMFDAIFEISPSAAQASTSMSLEPTLFDEEAENEN